MAHDPACVVKVAHSDEDCTTNEWEVVGKVFDIQSDSDPFTRYAVTVRNDTQNGGTYLHCTCPSWVRSIKKGGCKHVIRVRGGRTTAVPSRFPCHQCGMYIDQYGKPRKVEFSNVTDLNIHIKRNHNRAPRSEADMAAAARILAWKGGAS